MRRMLAAACLASMAPVWAGAQEVLAEVDDAEGFIVVVSARNPHDAIDLGALRRIFLKQSGSWPDGGEAHPVDQSATSAVREAFSRRVLRQPLAAVRAFWQRQILAGRSTPPPVKTSDAEVLELVASDARAVGYVAPATALPADVKELELTDPDEADPDGSPLP